MRKPLKLQPINLTSLLTCMSNRYERLANELLGHTTLNYAQFVALSVLVDEFNNVIWNQQQLADRMGLSATTSKRLFKQMAAQGLINRYNYTGFISDGRAYTVKASPLGRSQLEKGCMAIALADRLIEEELERCGISVPWVLGADE